MLYSNTSRRRRLQTRGLAHQHHHLSIIARTTMTIKMLTYRKKRKKRIKVCALIGSNLSLFGVCLWPVVVSLAALLLPQAAGEDVPGVVSTSSNPSGELCGFPPQRRCLDQSSCTQFGQCECPRGTSGDGGFHCYNKNAIQAQIIGNSQLLRTFRNTSVVIGWPCRFRLTEFSTGRKGIDHTCLFQIFAVNEIVGGRIVTTGSEVHLQVTKGSEIVGGVGIRTDGKLSNGVFRYTEWGRNQFIKELPVTDTDDHYDNSILDASGSGDGTILDDEEDGDEEDDKYDWGPPEELEAFGDRVGSEIDRDNFATVNVARCGATVRFRAPDLTGVDESQTPGLCVSISKEQERVVFQSPQTYLSETHSRSSLSKSARQKNISVGQEVLYRTMVYAARQRRTKEGTECEDTARLFRSHCENTSKRIAALKSCSFFLENPDLIYCMDPPSGRASSNSLNTFKLCVWNSCRPSSPVCNLMKSRINQRGCTSLLPVNFSQLYCAV